MKRGAPSEMSRLRPPDRGVRVAPATTCPHCSEQVATRHGLIAGHYYGVTGTAICPGTNQHASDLRRTR